MWIGVAGWTKILRISGQTDPSRSSSIPEIRQPFPTPRHTPETPMDAPDAAELISEIREARASHEADDKFRDRAALLIALLAMLLAVGSLGGGNVAEDMVHNNIKASDTRAFYQAKNVRQTQYR